MLLYLSKGDLNMLVKLATVLWNLEVANIDFTYGVFTSNSNNPFVNRKVNRQKRRK